jgi:hypothetical protein
MKVATLSPAVRKLKGRALAIERTGEIVRRNDEKWEKCIFTLELTRFSSRTSAEQIPSSLKGKKVKIARYCLYDWHYKLDIEKTLEPDETEAILKGKPSGTVYW